MLKLRVLRAGVYLKRFRNVGEVLYHRSAPNAAYLCKGKRAEPADAATAERLAPLVKLDRHELGRMAGLEPQESGA